jgi:crotonobetainyl-CoA:carnitine CoA-transferase CaiB-like acyl-CoA transferase
MAMNWGKRSIALDLRDDADRATFDRLARVADVIVENQLAGFWLGLGVDFAALRRHQPELVVCSVTGFGQTGPYANLPSHGLNMDALADTLNVVNRNGTPRLGWTYTSWGNELGSAHAALAIVAAVLEARTTGRGAWIDLSCWDALVESHRTELAMTVVTGTPFNMHDSYTGEMYNAYAASDGKLVLIAALEGKFWENFCRGVGRVDLIAARGTDAELHFAWDDETLRQELEVIFRTATADEWDRRFVEWDVPGSRILQVPEVVQLDHYRERAIVEGEDGSWPNVMSPIRWHDTADRAGAGLTPPPAMGENTADVLRDWLGE